MSKVTLVEKFIRFDETWNPKIVNEQTSVRIERV